MYCQAHGYPTGGPRQDDPAYDDVIQAESGLADAAARVAGQPMLAPTVLADKVCSLTIVYSVTAALYRRARTGEGEHIEVPMQETFEAFTLVEHGAEAVPRPPVGPAGYQRVLTPHRRPWPTRDGWMVVLPYTKEQYDRIFAAAGREDLLGDERYATGRQRIANSGFLYDLVGRMLASRTTAEWLTFFREQDVPAGAVASLDDLVDQLPEAEHPHAGVLQAGATSGALRPGAPERAPAGPPHRGAHRGGAGRGRLRPGQAGRRCAPPAPSARFRPSSPEPGCRGRGRTQVADDHDRHEQP